MMDNSWEYAVVEWFRFNVEQTHAGEVDAKAAQEKTIAAFSVRYADGAGKVIYRPVHQITTKNVGDKSKNLALIQVLGLLGGAGWELVTMNQEPDRIDVCTITAVYFKRPFVAGRAVDEPQIDLDFLS